MSVRTVECMWKEKKITKEGGGGGGGGEKKGKKGGLICRIEPMRLHCSAKKNWSMPFEQSL